ncbi:MAG: MBL fold metallo-hydrolase [Candidatus Daviesbacteria bacterium]|nr:MBL fold metallo-hydrolase [Candidatus Daviesbacteria bacterium]
MDIHWLGHSCFKIKGKSATVIIDPFDPEFTGLKLSKDLAADVALSTHEHKDHNYTEAVTGDPLLVSGPGEYEKAGVTIVGIRTFHDNVKGSERGINTIYHIFMDGINIIHLGDLGHVLTEEQLSLIDQSDIVMIPVGGGPTIEGEDAVKVIAQLEPKIVIPMHYKEPGLKFDLGDVEPFLKEMAAENIEPQSKLSITKDKLPDTTTVVVLAKS